MTKSSYGKAVAATLAMLLVAVAAQAHLNLTPPYAAIEYNAAQAEALHGSAEAFSKTTPILLHDVQPGDATYWIKSTVTQLITLRGYAHLGTSGNSQQAANAKVQLIQIWSWRDTNGNGRADADDTTAQWTKLIEHQPGLGGGDGSGGNVVGWSIPYPTPAIATSTWQGDVLQSKSIDLTQGQSLLLLIRVVDISGNTSLMTAVAGLEQWDNGVVDGVGSDVPDDRYLDCDGNTPGTTDGRIEDDDVVWLYVPRLK